MFFWVMFPWWSVFAVRSFADLPLKEKLVILTLGVSFTTLVFASSAFYLYQLRNAQRNALESASTVSKVIASSVTAAVAFDDKKAAAEALGAFEQSPDVNWAVIVTDNDDPFASYSRDRANTAPPRAPDLSAPHAIFHDRIVVRTPITHENEHLGWLYTEHSLLSFQVWVNQSIAVALLVLGFGGIVAYILASRSARFITSSILSLSRSMTEISSTRNYAIRVASESQDEIGNLVLRFNDMLAEIETRDAMLRNYQGTLEHKVVERTAELEAEVQRRAVIEAALRREQEQLRTIVESSPVAIAMLDSNLCYLAHSRQWLKDYGLPSSSLVGRNHYEVFPDIPEEWREVHRRALSGQIQSCAEDCFKRADGGSMYLRWAIHPWYTPEGVQGGVIMATQNIDDLVHAREEALHAAATRSQFLANVSHELRTPLNGIIGFTDLLLDEEELPAVQRSYLEAIKSSGSLLLTLINDILDFSKLEQRKVGLELLPFSLDDSIAAAVSIVKATADAKGLAMEVNLDDGIPQTLLGDSLRIKQVLVNLLANAVKFTARGGITVAVRAVEHQAAGVSLLFTVTDTGIGIPHEKIGLIFEAFAQADGSTTRKFGGTGLGLTICLQLIQLMGGQIWVESEVNRGSSFFFTLFLQKATESLLSPTVGVTNSGRYSIAPTRPLSILVAEDNPLNQKLIVTLLRKAGHQVSIAGNGAEAVEQCGVHSFDIILMDLQMPVLSGLDATRLIRQREKSQDRHIPIVALTAHAFDDHKQQCIDVGMDGFLTKPIRRDELFDTLSAVAEQRDRGN